MKNVLLTLCLLVSATLAYSQVVINNVDVNSLPDVKYIEVQCVTKPAKGKDACIVYVDYGQRWNAGAEAMMIGPSKAPIEFDGHMAVLNYFHKNGWELVPYQIDQSPTSKTYIFQKKN